MSHYLYSSYEDLVQAGPSTSVDYSEYCAYCQESLSDEYNPTRRTKCGHRLHLACMNQYLPDEKKCPICSTPIKWMDITDKCAICFDPIGDIMHTTIPNCEHEMHTDCLKQWFVTKKRCPVCRKSLMYMADTISDFDENEQYDEEVSDEQLSEEQSEEIEDYSHSSNQYTSGSYTRSYSGTEDDYESYSDEEEVVNNDYYEEHCLYCTKSFATTTDPQKRFRCGHIFHMRCANIHLPKTKQCGVCHTPIPNWINTNDMCVGCKCLFTAAEERFTSICQHQLHVSCVKKIKRKNCPICNCKLEGKSSDAMCAICLESFPSVQDTFVTRCNHKFHNSCINTWKDIDNICPICRERL